MNKERLVNTFLDLVRIPSPSRNERRVADYILNFCNANGIEVYEDDANIEYGGNAGNIVAILRAENKKRLMFSAHMDTVLPCDEINPIIDDEVIRSDGTSILGGDDKCGIAAMLEMMLNVKSLTDRPELIFVFSFGEENGLNGPKYMDTQQLGKIDGAYILDSSGRPGEIVKGAPYFANGVLKVIGKEAHAGICPEKGVNALCVAAQAITQLHIGRVEEETTCNLGEVKGGLAYNIVMPSVEIVFEARSLNHDKLENLLNQVHLVFKETCSELNARFESTVKIQTPGFMIDEDDEISRAVVNACEKIGLQAEFKTSGGASDANIYNSKGIKSLNLACGMSEVHTVQEYLRIEDLVKTTELITALMEEYK